MTAEYIAQLKHSRERVEITRLNNQQALDQHKRSLTALENKCDHKMPDGSSAMDNGTPFSSCNLCNHSEG